MKAYSVDLRQKIIDTYENEKISQRQLAQRFRVTLGFITKLLKQYRETGDISSKTSPGRPRQLNEEQIGTIKALHKILNALPIAATAPHKYENCYKS